MNIKETVDLVIFAIKRYQDPDTKRRVSLLEYYSITEMSPKALAKEANKLKLCSSAAAIINFNEENCWNLMELKMSDRYRHFHSFNGVELSKDDKLSIYERLVSKGYPLLEGVYDREAYLYANNFDFSKEEMKERIITAYNIANPNKKIVESKKTTDVKVLKKVN